MNKAPRDTAWSLQQNMYAATVSPDGTAEQSYYDAIINSNAEIMQGFLGITGTNLTPSSTNSTCSGYPPGDSTPSTATRWDFGHCGWGLGIFPSLHTPEPGVDWAQDVYTGLQTVTGATSANPSELTVTTSTLNIGDTTVNIWGATGAWSVINTPGPAPVTGSYGVTAVVVDGTHVTIPCSQCTGLSQPLTGNVQISNGDNDQTLSTDFVEPWLEWEEGIVLNRAVQMGFTDWSNAATNLNDRLIEEVDDSEFNPWLISAYEIGVKDGTSTDTSNGTTPNPFFSSWAAVKNAVIPSFQTQSTFDGDASCGGDHAYQNIARALGTFLPGLTDTCSQGTCTGSSAWTWLSTHVPFYTVPVSGSQSCHGGNDIQATMALAPLSTPASIPAISSFSASSSLVLSGGTSTLSWNVTNASSVAITPGSFSTSTLIGSTMVNPTSTTIYMLTATNSNGTSTSAVTVTVDSTPPTMSTSLTATATGTSTISLTWASSTDSGGPGLSGYNIFRCTSGSSCTPSVMIATSSGASYHDSGLTASTIYTYAVSAFDTLGLTSATSTSASTTTENASGPTVLSFSASPSIFATTGSSTLSWHVVNASSVAIMPGSFSTTTLIGSTLVNFTSTTAYTLTASSNNGTSTATTTVIVDTIPPSVPTSVAATAASASEIDLSWASSTDSGGSGLAGYDIYRNGTKVATTSLPAYADTSLSASTLYSYYLDAFDFAGNVSATSTVVSATTQAASSGGGGGGGSVGVSSGGGGGGGFYTPPVTTSTPSGTSSISSASTATSPSSGTGSILPLFQELKTLSIQLFKTANTNNRPLTVGSEGQDVWVLQELLILDDSGPEAMKLASIGPTGYFGTLTQSTLAEYQKLNGITPAVGYFGQKTREAIMGTGTTPISPASSAPLSIPAPSDTITQDLYPGDSGPQVTLLQNLLTKDDDYAGPITGYYGQLTEQAVQAFQAKYGIVTYGSPDATGYGTVGPKTRGEIDSL
jgi:peptidoglycan hydrolase-like protein with peptidoglycan-binding domain